MGVGAALGGYRPVMVHQRLDFFLLAMDQLVNSAAKWYYMFGGQRSVPIVIRLVLGRGWGQGPTHSQNLQSWFAHIPGLKVVMPTSPADAKGLLLSSIFDDNPVVFLEHRWLHNSVGEVPESFYQIPIGQANVMKEGSDVTIVSMSYMTAEAVKAAAYLKEKANIHAEIVDLRSVRPIDWETINRSVKKTGRLLVLDTGVETCSVAAEIVAKVAIDNFSSLSQAPVRIALPDHPTPTSFGLTKHFYPTSETIVQRVSAMFGKSVETASLQATSDCPHDVPGDWFRGPF